MLSVDKHVAEKIKEMVAALERGETALKQTKEAADWLILRLSERGGQVMALQRSNEALHQEIARLKNGQTEPIEITALSNETCCRKM